jgi:Mg-chelatase subunit ChlD
MKYLNFANHVKSNEQPETLLTLIDLSGSMEIADMKPTRRAAATKANQEIIRVKSQQHPDDKIGVIGFQSSAKLLLAPTTPSEIVGLKRTIDNAVLSGGTDFVTPLELAYDCFFRSVTTTTNSSLSKFLSTIFFEPAQKIEINSKIGTSKTTKRIIMLTDGEHLGDGNPITVAVKLKKAGVIIDCIGIGGSPKDVDEALLKRIASRNSDGSIRYCFIGDQEQLIRKYQSLAQHIRIA